MSQGGDKPDDNATSNEGPRWAADEPTAMWDEQSLRDKGYEDAASAPRVATGPATAPSVGGEDAAKVHAPSVSMSSRNTGGHPTVRRAPPPGLSWPVTVAVAVIVAVVVYFAVRTLVH